MKEAAGEANMTVITIVLIAIVLAIGTVIVNGMMGSVKKNSCCQSMGGAMEGGSCKVRGADVSEDAGYKSCLEGETE